MQPTQNADHRNIWLNLGQHPAQWPAKCIVCGAPCRETKSVRSFRHYLTPTIYQIALQTGIQRFSVPVHLNTGRCSSRLTWGIYLNAYWYGIVFLISIAIGSLIWAYTKYGHFGFIPGMLFTIVLVGIPGALLFVPRVRIIESIPELELHNAFYGFSFRDKNYARDFYELNRGLVVTDLQTIGLRSR